MIFGDTSDEKVWCNMALVDPEKGWTPGVEDNVWTHADHKEDGGFGSPSSLLFYLLPTDMTKDTIRLEGPKDSHSATEYVSKLWSTDVAQKWHKKTGQTARCVKERDGEPMAVPTKMHQDILRACNLAPILREASEWTQKSRSRAPSAATPKKWSRSDG